VVNPLKLGCLKLGPRKKRDFTPGFYFDGFPIGFACPNFPGQSYKKQRLFGDFFTKAQGFFSFSFTVLIAFWKLDNKNQNSLFNYQFGLN